MQLLQSDAQMRSRSSQMMGAPDNGGRKWGVDVVLESCCHGVTRFSSELGGATFRVRSGGRWLDAMLGRFAG
jgi:hypothetical protein